MATGNKLDNILRARQLWRDRQDRKRFIRESNASTRDRRSPQEQLHMLDLRLGLNDGAKRERVRLAGLVV